MATSSTHVEPQNERGHIYKFSPLPQYEKQTEDKDNEDQPLSISIQSSDTGPTISDYYSDEIFSDRARNCEMIQDLLGFAVFLMLIFLPLFRCFVSPNGDPVPPIFILNSMYISNFTTGMAGLGATWDAKFTVINTNVSTIYFQSIGFTIFYKQNPEDALSTASSYPFYLDQGEHVKLHLKFTTTGLEDDDQSFVENRLVEEIGRDRARDGSLSFGMQMNVQAIYYGETWVSDVMMSPHCEDLTVQFLPNKNSGRLANPNRNFSVPIQWKPSSFF